MHFILACALLAGELNCNIQRCMDFEGWVCCGLYIVFESVDYTVFKYSNFDIFFKTAMMVLKKGHVPFFKTIMAV